MYVVQDSIVAFLDILGFKDLAARNIHDVEFMNRLDKILSLATDVLGGRLCLNKEINTRMFSDCICASCPISAKNIIEFLYVLETFQLGLATHGVFIRGAVCIGPHFETPRMIMSQGLISAYEIETKIAKFPRIVISHETVKALEEASTRFIEEKPWAYWRGITHSFNKHIWKDVDGISFLNYLADIHAIDSSATADQYISAHKQHIAQWVDDGIESGLTPSKASKYQWLITYHNRALEYLFPHGGIEDDLIDETQFELM